MSGVITFGTRRRTYFPLAIEHHRLRSSIYIMGSPIMGKSTLLGNLAEQFVAAGDGVLLLDIKGDLAQEVASRTRHPDNVIYVKMGPIAFPGNDIRFWTLNPFDGHRQSEAAMEQVRQAVLDSFERMGLAQLGSMANIRATLRTAINTALTLAEPTYLDLLVLVIEESYRTNLVTTQKHLDHITRRHWADLDDKSITPPSARRTEINTSRNRLETLLDSPNINLPVGQYHSTLRLREWLDEGKMVIVDLGLPLHRDTGVDLGNMIMAQITAETFLRGRGVKSRTWRIIVDEFHLFVGQPFADIIRDGRSFNVFPVVAHQDRGQFRTTDDGESPLKGAVGHAGVSLNLHPSVEDRVSLAALHGPEQADTFLALKQYKAVIGYYASLADSYASEAISLNDWWGDPVPGQLAELQMAAYPHTVAKSDLVESNRRRYWDHLDGIAKNDTRKAHVPKPRRQPKTKTDPPAEIRPRPNPGQTGGPGEAPEPPPSPPRPGVARPPRVIDQRDDAGPALPRPPRRGPKPQEP